MNIRRRGILAAAVIISLSTATLALAQGPGGGRPGGGGPGGGGPGGGRGGFGGRGGNRSILQLVQIPAVQEEITLTDAQKTKIEAIAQASRTRRDALSAQAGFGRNGNRNGGNNNGGNNGGNGNANNGNGGNNGGGRGNRGGNGNGGGNGGNVAANGGNGGGNGGNGGGGGFGQGGPGGFGQGGPGGFGPGGGGPGGPPNMTDEQRAQRQEFFAAMQQLDKDTDTAVLKVLDAKQRTRVSQIKLQSQGLNAFRTPELIAALKIPEVRAQEIAEILDVQNQARREQFGQMREVFAQFAANNNGQPPSREQMQALRDNPEFQAKMDATRKKIDEATASLEDKTKAAIARLLTKKQRDQYDKMLGEPFDLASLNTGRGGPGGRNNGNNNNAANGGNANPTTPAAGTTTPATPPTGTGAGTATQPARKSLRERRGGSPG